MFLEPHFRLTSEDAPAIDTGWVEVICGSMFSGKTEELIRRLKRAKLAKLRVAIFKPVIDTRYHLDNIVSHNQNSIQSTPVASSKEIILQAVDCHIIGIDEAQFFDANLPEVCNFLASRGKRVIVAGLDMDFEGKPFGCMPQLMAEAEFITKVHAICMRCGGVAGYSYRKVKSKETLLLGETETYEARCRRCFNHGMDAQ